MSSPKKRLFKLPKWLLITIILVLVIALAFGAYLIFFKKNNLKATDKINTFTVTRQTIQHTVTGSGAIEPNDQYEITPLVKGEILSAHFEEGDMVEKGDIMYVIDSSDQESTTKRAQNSLKQAQTSYDDALEDYNDLTVTSPVSGTVTSVYLEKGDNAGSNSKVMDVVNTDIMTLKIPFISQDADKISVGQSATVNVEGSYYSLTGKVTYIAAGASVNSEGVSVRNVEIEVENPGALEEGDKATAIIGNVACNSSGTFENSITVSILSKASGEIIYQPYRVGDVIKSGDVALKIDSTSVDKQINNAEINLESAQISYDNTLDQLDDYTITAPISGTVIQKNLKAGDTLDSSTSGSSMAVIADMSRMTFDISIDELDIQLLEVGQKATITADAFEGQTFSGTVDYISIIGTTSNGVTSYPVTIVLDDAGDLLPGMNVDATIVVSESIDALVVPVDAVQRNNIVYVKDDGSSNKTAAETQGEKPVDGKMPQRNNGEKPVNGEMPQRISGEKPSENAQIPQESKGTAQAEKPQQGEKTRQNGENKQTDKQAPEGNMPMNFGKNAPEGFKAVKVELGINNDAFIEILSGLKEGDVVYVQASTSSSQTQQTGFPGGMGGGMPGGMPSGMPGGMGGGMPSGGMPSGGMRTGGGGMMQ